MVLTVEFMTRAGLYAYLADSILGMKLAHPVRVAIDGPDCAGKSTLADELAAELAPVRPVVRLSIDDFHNPAAIRRRRGDLSPDGYYHDSFNVRAIVDEVLQPLGRNVAAVSAQHCSTTGVMSPASVRGGPRPRGRSCCSTVSFCCARS
jgi:ABC-type hemin transport system ATPase subunit